MGRSCGGAAAEEPPLPDLVLFFLLLAESMAWLRMRKMWETDVVVVVVVVGQQPHTQLLPPKFGAALDVLTS